VVAVKKPLTANWRGRLHYRRDQTSSTLAKIDASQRLIHLERPLLPGLRIDMVPIE
jgi:hypothetical protein